MYLQTRINKQTDRRIDQHITHRCQLLALHMRLVNYCY